MNLTLSADRHQFDTFAGDVIQSFVHIGNFVKAHLSSVGFGESLTCKRENQEWNLCLTKSKCTGWRREDCVPEITSNNSISFRPFLKSSSMFSIWVPALRRWELHQAVNVWSKHKRSQIFRQWHHADCILVFYLYVCRNTSLCRLWPVTLLRVIVSHQNGGKTYWPLPPEDTRVLITQQCMNRSKQQHTMFVLPSLITPAQNISNRRTCSRRDDRRFTENLLNTSIHHIRGQKVPVTLTVVMKLFTLNI